MSKKNNEEIIIPGCFIEETEEYSSLLLPNPNQIAYYKDLNNRVIYIDDFCVSAGGDNNLLPVTRQILAFNQEDEKAKVPVEKRKPIKLMIYTYGGGLELALAFANLCLISKTPIYTYNMGLALSAGFIILLAGHKRFALPNSQALIHEGSGTISGTAQQTELHMANYKKQLEKVKGFVLGRTKITSAVYNKKAKTEWFIWADELVSLGIVEEVIFDINQLY